MPVNTVLPVPPRDINPLNTADRWNAAIRGAGRLLSGETVRCNQYTWWWSVCVCVYVRQGGKKQTYQ